MDLRQVLSMQNEQILKLQEQLNSLMREKNTIFSKPSMEQPAETSYESASEAPTCCKYGLL